MTHTIITLYPDGMRTSMFEKPVLRTLQEECGGYVQELPGFTTFEGRRCRVYCNENGFPEQKKFNQTGSDAWFAAYCHSHPKQKPYLSSSGFTVLGNLVIVIKGDHKVNEETLTKKAKP